MNKKDKVIFGSILIIALAAVLIALAGMIAWQLLGIKQEPPLNAWWVLFNHPNPAAKSMAIKLLALPVGFFILIPILCVFGYYKQKARWVYGKAKLANSMDVRGAELFDNPKKGDKGIFLGFFKGKAIYDKSPEHILLVAETRTMKGVSIIIPILLTYDQSMIIHDPKPELWDITAAYRKKCGHEVYKFSCFDENTHRFNPFFYVDEDNPIDFIQQLSYFYYPNPTHSDPMWASQARSLFQGLALYILYVKGKEELTFGNILRLGQNGDLAKFIKTELVDKEHILSSNCKRLLESFAGITEKTRSGVLTQFISALDIFENPVVDAATSGNDFDLRDIRKKRMTVYVCSRFENVNRVETINKILFQTATILNTRDKPEDNDDLKFKCLYVLDEQYYMGKLEVVTKNLPFLAGFGIRILSVFQSDTQVYELHGRELGQTYIDNHKTRIYYLPTRDNLEALCNKIGFTTKKVYSGGNSKSYSLQKVLLFNPDELSKRLGDHNGLLFLRGIPPILFKKAVYHNDSKFISRIVEPKDIKKALAAKDMKALLPFLIQKPEVPKAFITEKTSIAEDVTQIKLDAIKKPHGATTEEMDDFIRQTANALGHTELTAIDKF